MLKLAKVSLILFLISTFKTLPFAYLIRFYVKIFQYIVFQRRAFDKNRQNTFAINSPKDLFKWIDYNTYVSPLEIDMYLHKSNSTYFTDLDIARTKLICIMFQKLFFNYHDNVSGEFKTKSLKNLPFIPVATVQSTFKHELTVFQRFTIKSRILSWDGKWLFILSKFVTKKNGKERVNCISVTKYVFKKKKRITIPPKEMLQECGLWDENVELESEKNGQLIDQMKDVGDLEAIE